ncbi:MAG: DUF177 domain-containing protein [Pseudomonadota bacterium]
MKIRIDEIPEEGLEVVFSGDKDVLTPEPADRETPQGVRMDPRIKGHVRLIESGESLLLSARVRTTLHLSCFRCLAEFDSDHEIDVDLVVRRKEMEGAENEHLDDSTANEVWTEGPELDLGTLLAQEFLLDVPMKPLCTEDCLGLCARCGALKGSKECTCREQDEIDPRWQVLAKLKEQAPR